MLKLINYGQNDGNFGPDVNLIGEPGIDNTTLFNAGYFGGKVVALRTSATASRGNVVFPCDASAGNVPYGFLLNGPGEFASAITPSGSKKIGVVRAFPEILVDSQAYDTASTFTVGFPVFVGGSVNGKTGLVVSTAATSATSGVTPHIAPIGTVTGLPTTSFPWLGIASLL
jgi:hypothetical protein